MLPSSLLDALRILARYLASSPDARQMLLVHWGSAEARGSLIGVPIPSPEVLAAADHVDRAVPPLTRASGTAQALRAELHGELGGALLTCLEAATNRGDVRLAPLLSAAARIPTLASGVEAIARARVLGGPLLDALASVPLSGATWFAEGSYVQCRARLEILLWEAGAVALQTPELGPWLWGDSDVFDALVRKPARGALRDRVIAARCIEVAAPGMPPTVSPVLRDTTLKTLQPLLLHPEPIVWVHAARAFGRLTGVIDGLEGTVLDWSQGESIILRQRAVAAFASMPPDRMRVLAGELARVLDAPQQEPWVLAAAATATPYLLVEHKDLWDRLANRILAGEGGPFGARWLAKGLGALWRRGYRSPSVEAPMRNLRELARRARTESLNDWRHWLDVLSEADALDGAERDPLDIERGLENLTRLAAQYDDEEADARAVRFAASLATVLQESQRLALTEPRPRRRAAGLNALEGAARTLALRLWGPLLLTHVSGSPLAEPELDDAWHTLENAPEAILDEIAARRTAGELDDRTASVLGIIALRLGGYTLDACSEEPTLGPGRGPTAHRICLWLRKLAAFRGVSQDLLVELNAALSALCWRLVDTTRGWSLGEGDDARWLGPFAAWWAVVIDRPGVLAQVTRSLPLLTPGVLDRCVEQADAMRAALDPSAPQASEGLWADTVAAVLATLHADKTELARALAHLARALSGFASTSGTRPDLDVRCTELALASERVMTALENPVLALRESDGEETFVSQGAPRVGAQVAVAIRGRDLASLDVWFDSLGPVVRELVTGAVSAAMRRTPPPPPQARSVAPMRIEDYELVRPLGEGGVGSVWLVRKAGGERFFVLKIPKADALAGASDTERAQILASFEEEARSLAGLYHPNIASIIDRGAHKGLPFLVLEYLIGADLRTYSAARRMNVHELRSVVNDTCAALATLHAAGLVHRDVKPANVWLRLPLKSGEAFDPAQHRDPARVPVLATVVIDMGMVRAFRVAQEAMGRFVAGTPGYLAPEQVLDPIVLDGRADVYALAGTIYHGMTGRSFFDDLGSPRERIFAHMNREPLEDPERVQGFSVALTRLLRAATQRDPKHRPTAAEFAREFAALS